MNKILLFVLSAVGAFILNAYSPVAAENRIDIEKELPANSSAPTEIFGSAANASGGQNESFVEQGADEENPLGNPIVFAPEASVNSAVSNKTSSSTEKEPGGNSPVAGIKPIEQTTDQGILKPWEEPLPQPSNKIENELYQSGNDIIDVQAYPIKDVSTVTEPNIQPTIVTQ